LLPGRAFAAVVEGRGDLDFLLIPAESLNDSNVFLDDMTFHALEDRSATILRASHWIVDAFEEESS
jgi:hypothetical protein